MVLTLEALNARFGDALMLYYGQSGATKLIVIDAGPGGVYKNSVRPRLAELRGDSDDPLPIELLMVSHIDRDHVTGVISLTRELLKAKEKDEPAPYDILKLWHNSFDDILGNKADALGAAVGSAVEAVSNGGGTLPAGLHLGEPAAAIVADVKQGRELRQNADLLGLLVNEGGAGQDKLIMAPKTGAKVVNMGDGLRFTVLGPSRARLEELQTEWDAKLTQLGLGQDAESVAAAFLDKSVPNLSSIVVLAEADGKRMLLTGDARGDYILDGLRTAGLLTGGKIHVDLLKLPHHGSDRNVSTDFFRKVTADRYVISADGTYDNPDIATLQMISEARGQDEFTIYLTNWEQRLEDFFRGEKQNGKKYEFVFREDDDTVPLRIDLSDPLG